MPNPNDNMGYSLEELLAMQRAALSGGLPGGMTPTGLPQMGSGHDNPVGYRQPTGQYADPLRPPSAGPGHDGAGVPTGVYTKEQWEAAKQAYRSKQ